MSSIEISPDIFNGARCKTYNWSQSYTDLEIRIKLRKVVKYENVDVIIDSDKIKVTLEYPDTVRHKNSPRERLNDGSMRTETLMEGEFEHTVDTESAFWLLDNEEPSIIIYIDKAEDLWWKQLLVNEEATVLGFRNYTVPMDDMDDGSRMAIDKLIADQRNKMATKTDRYSFW